MSKLFSISVLKKSLVLISLCCAMTISLLNNLSAAETINRYTCIVSSEEMAIDMAMEVLLEKYGDSIYDELPLTAELVKGFWIVSGTLPESNKKNVGILGGVGYVIIKKIGCDIIYVIHEH